MHALRQTDPSLDDYGLFPTRSCQVLLMYTCIYLIWKLTACCQTALECICLEESSLMRGCKPDLLLRKLPLRMMDWWKRWPADVVMHG